MSQVSAHVDENQKSFDRRVHLRQSVRSLAYVELGEGNGGIVLNVSEGGIAVQAVMSLRGDELSSVKVQLSHSKKNIEAKGRIRWTSGLRKTAGVEFIGLSQEARSLLREWVALESPSREFVEEITNPIKKNPSESAARRPLETAEKVDLKPEPAVPPSKWANKVAEFRQEVRDGAEPVTHPSASRTSSAFNEVPNATAVFAPAAPEALREMPPAAAEHVPAVLGAATAPAASVEPVGEPALAPLGQQGPSSLPADRFGFKQSRTLPGLSSPAAPPEVRWKLAKLVAIVAGISLAAGWFAGHSALRGVFSKAASEAPRENVSAENSHVLPPIHPKISNIDVVDLNNQHWLIPMQGPVGTPQTPAAHAEGSTSVLLQQDKVSPEVTLRPPVHPQIQDARANDGAGTPVSAPSPGGSESVSPASADHDLQPAVAIPTPDLPAVDPVAKNLQSGELLRRVEPVYPPSALAQGIEGTVTLYAVIGANGAVSSLKSLDGPAALVPAAIAAVRQWRYSPSLLNGRPIQTERQIKIVFQLSKPQ